MSVANPALLASLFLASITLAPREHDTDPKVFTVALSDGSAYQLGGIVAHEDGDRVALHVDGETELINGPLIPEQLRAEFVALGLLPEPAPVSIDVPAGPTDEEIARDAEKVQVGIDAAIAASAARATAEHPELAQSVEVTEGGFQQVPVQQQYDRLLALLDVFDQHMPSQMSWVTHEMRVIYADLGITKST